MAGARFQVVSLPRSVLDSRSAAARDAKVRATEPPTPGRRFTWRFLAANNRSLATATTVFPDASSCLEALRAVRRALPIAVCEFSRDDDGLWRWTIRLDDVEVASATSYRRHVRARITCDNFLALAGDPATLENVQVVYR